MEGGKRPEDFPNDTNFKITFTGNVGYAQGLDILPSVAGKLKEKGIKVDFVIIGDGRYMSEFKAEIARQKVADYFYLLGRKPATEIPRYLSVSDAGFISFANNELFNMTIPAKLQSYMACGKMIIAVAGGETRRIIEEADCGFCVDIGDIATFLSELDKWMVGKYDTIKFGNNAVEYACANFEKNKLMQYCEHILGLEKNDRTNH